MNGALLRELRLDRRYTLQQLEELSGVDQRTISDIEHGRNQKPAYDKVVNLARALNVEPSLLWPVPSRQEPEAASETAVAS